MAFTQVVSELKVGVVVEVNRVVKSVRRAEAVAVL